MTPDDAYIATRDLFVGLLHAQAKAQGLSIGVAQIYGMLDTALERSGMRTLIEVVAAADTAAVGYAGTYEETPETVAGLDGTWRASRVQLDDYPNLAGLLPIL